MLLKLERFVRWADWLSKWTGKVVAYLILAMLGIQLTAVVLRYAFANPVHWVVEVMTYMWSWYLMIGGAFVLLNNEHIRMDLLFERQSKRRQAVLDLSTSIVVFLFIGILFVIGADKAWESLLTMERSRTAFHPLLVYIKVSVPVGAFLLLIQQIAQCIRCVSIITRGTDFEKLHRSADV